MTKTTLKFWPHRLCITLLFFGFTFIVFFFAYSGFSQPYDDLPSFYWATKITWQEQLSPYQSSNFTAISDILQQKIYPFLYPPQSLLLFYPLLTCGDYLHCKAIFTSVNATLWVSLGLVFGWGYYRLRREAHSPLQTIIGLTILWLTLALFGPLINTLKTGQINLIVFALMAPTLIIAAQPLTNFTPKKQFISGLLLSLGICLKLYLALLLIPLVLAKQWRLVTGSFIGLSALTVCSFWLLPDLWQDWITLRLPLGGYGQRVPGVLTVPWNQSINGFIIRGHVSEGIFKGLGNGAIWAYSVNMSVFCSTTLLAYLAIKRYQYGLLISCCLFLVTIPLIAPLTWLHHLIFILPSLFLAFYTSNNSKNYRQLFLLSVCTLIICFPWLLNSFFSDYVQQLQTHQPYTHGLNLFLSSQMLATTGIILTLTWQILAKQFPGKKIQPN